MNIVCAYVHVRLARGYGYRSSWSEVATAIGKRGVLVQFGIEVPYAATTIGPWVFRQ